MKDFEFDVVFGSQRVFRSILDGFSYPGKVKDLSFLKFEPCFGLNKASIGILFTLLDQEVSFATSPYQNEIEKYFFTHKRTNLEKIENADFILSLSKLSEIEKLKKGDLLYPERGATVVCIIEEIKEEGKANFLNLILTGPGINGKSEISVKGLDKEEILKIKEVNNEFPLGVDFIFTDEKNKVFCLPRSTEVKVGE